MKDASTREEILTYIQNHRSVTAAEIAEAMNLSGAAVRYHLGLLRKANLIEVDPQVNPNKNRGRPAQSYRPMAQAVPHNLIRLTTALLQNYLSQPNIQTTEVWQYLSNHLATELPLHTSLSRRLPLTVEQLNQMNYAARWEAGPRGPRILFFNCPYAALLPTFPGLCQMDLLILEKMLGRPIQQSSRFDLEIGRNRACIFETIK